MNDLRPRGIRGEVLAVVGGQYGSEGKGVVVQHIANRYQNHIRVGGSNAGHSITHLGRIWKMQSVPCGWVNSNATLWLGRGMLIDLENLQQEIEAIREVDPSIIERIRIDPLAGVMDERHKYEEGGVEGEMHRRIGSTGKGVGAARHGRMRRDPSEFRLFKDACASFGNRFWDGKELIWPDTPRLLMHEIEAGRSVLLEGTQGSGLSLIHGPWPYVTSADTNAAQLAADVGLPPRVVNRTCMVVRSHPIRVAGNSGPMYNEITWEEMSRRLGKSVTEQTTVTKKTRRIGEWDEQLVADSVVLNAPTSIALMFADYINPDDEGKTVWDALSVQTRQFVDYLEGLTGVRVALIGTGGKIPPDGPGWQVVDRGMRL